jgi:hypothetical protein
MLNKKTAALASFLMVWLGSAVIAPPSRAQKLKPEDVVARHLESIGPAEKRNAVKTRATAGTVEIAMRVGGTANITGKGNVISEGIASRLAYAFPALEYPGEQMAYDGARVTVMQINPGNYSPFGGFIYENNYPLKENLLMGVLGTGWALADIRGHQPKLDYNGVKKIDGQQVHELKYAPKNQKGAMQTTLYFDVDTFRHVRTQYRVERPPAQLNNIADSAELVRYQITERFSDFKEVDGLTLPHTYYLEFSIDAPRGASLTTWVHKIDQIIQNQPVEKRVFVTE